MYEEDSEDEDFVGFSFGRSSSAPPEVDQALFGEEGEDEAMPAFHSPFSPAASETNTILPQQRDASLPHQCRGILVEWPVATGTFNDTFPLGRFGDGADTVGYIEIHNKGKTIRGWSKKCSGQALPGLHCADCNKLPPRILDLVAIANEAKKKHTNHRLLNPLQLRNLLKDRDEEIGRPTDTARVVMAVAESNVPAAFHSTLHAQVWCTHRAGFEPIRDLPGLRMLPPPLTFPRLTHPNLSFYSSHSPSKSDCFASHPSCTSYSSTKSHSGGVSRRCRHGKRNEQEEVVGAGQDEGGTNEWMSGAGRDPPTSPSFAAWTLTAHTTHVRLLSCFLDAPALLFGVHHMALAGKAVKDVGMSLGRSAAAGLQVGNPL
ncbi:hypothetical protein B0H14DRAFT_3491490 [Mycena olivaceomarginata]|nr:hypothetical protein B0H14DRAFT_3491490 [Mycena olivaceomarginata]